MEDNKRIRSIGFVGDCGAGISIIKILSDAMANISIKPIEEIELNEFQKAGINISNEDSEKLTRIAINCGMSLDMLINMLTYYKDDKQMTNTELFIDGLSTGKSLKEILRELSNKYVQEITEIKDVDKSKKKQNWKKKNFYD